jgi:cytolysin-activating lysine-acyltransferase
MSVRALVEYDSVLKNINERGFGGMTRKRTTGQGAAIRNGPDQRVGNQNAVGGDTATATMTQTSAKPQHPKLDLSPAAAVGHVVRLMNQSERYRSYTVEDIDRVIAPPILLRQCRIYRHKGIPFGFISWAFLNEEAERGFIDGTRKLLAKDWNAGNRLWWIDLIFPRGGVKQVRNELEAIFPEKEGKYLRLNGKGERRIRTWYGMNRRASPDRWWWGNQSEQNP